MAGARGRRGRCSKGRGESWLCVNAMGKMVPFLYKTRQCFIWSLMHLTRVRARARASFEPHAPEFPPLYIPVECLQGWRKQSFDGRVIWLREKGSKMAGTYSCSPYLRGGADLLRLPPRKITDLTNEKHTLISV